MLMSQLVVKTFSATLLAHRIHISRVNHNITVRMGKVCERVLNLTARYNLFKLTTRKNNPKAPMFGSITIEIFAMLTIDN